MAIIVWMNQPPVFQQNKTQSTHPGFFLSLSRRKRRKNYLQHSAGTRLVAARWNTDRFKTDLNFGWFCSSRYLHCFSRCNILALSSATIQMTSTPANLSRTNPFLQRAKGLHKQQHFQRSSQPTWHLKGCHASTVWGSVEGWTWPAYSK